MSDERRPSAGDLFVDALEVPAAERVAWLAEHCPDAGLRAEVESLLAAHESAGGFLANPAIDTSLPGEGSTPEDLSGTRVGAYRLVRVIGRGGMSTVYLGERAEGDFEQKVAVKLIKRGMDSDPILQRFQNERRVLAALEHPNIARLIDGGATKEGRPYLVMEYVDGLSIDEYCDRHDLSVSERLDLFRSVCETVQHAHVNLIVHRDLKPSNILIDEEKRVKLLDFGIAKVLAPDDGEEAVGLTATAFRMMTPRYASPEQVRGEPVTTATDIYSLGVVLYELLTGKPPYELTRSAPSEVERVICGTEPTRPSDAVSEANRLSRSLTGDLDNIVMKALRKEPERRYVSAQGIAEDIRRNREGLPVRARPDTIRYRAGKFVRRNLPAVIAVAVIFAALIGATAVSTSLYLRAESALEEASTQRRTAAAVNEFLQRMLTAVDPVEMQSGEPVTVDRILAEAADRIDTELGSEPEVAAALHGTIAATYKHLGEPDLAVPHARARLELIEATQGPGSAEAIESRITLGQLLAILGRAEEADSLYSAALVAAEAISAGPSAYMADAIRELGKVREREGDYEAAKARVRQAIAIRRDLGEAQHGALATDLNSLGLILVRSGELGEAERVLREALDLIGTVHGEGHTFIGQVAANLGWALSSMGRYPEAAQHLKQAIALYDGVFGPDYPAVLSARGNLAHALQQMGELEGAEKLYLEVIAGARSRFGDRHENVGHTLNNYALMIEEEKRDDARAAELYGQALDIYVERFGPDHPFTAIARHNRARALWQADDAGAAETECRASLSVRRAILRENHPDIARSEHLLGEILLEGGDAAGAVEHLRAALAIREVALSPGHAATAQSELLLGICLARMGRPDEARPRLERAREKLAAAHGEADPRTARAAEALADLAR